MERVEMWSKDERRERTCAASAHARDARSRAVSAFCNKRQRQNAIREEERDRRRGESSRASRRKTEQERDMRGSGGESRDAVMEM
eukprot:1871597-Rhodomonas_salina.1